MARKSAIIKHIAVIKWPDKGPYAESHLMEGELLANSTLRWVGLGNYGNSFSRPLHVHAEVVYPCLSGLRRHLPCINFKDSARSAELPRWLSWYSICLEHRTLRVRVPPEAALLFLLEQGVVFGCRCLSL